MFDLDGTLIDIEPSYPKEVVRAVGDRLGIGFTDHEAEVLWYGMGGSRNQYLKERGISPETFWRTFHEVEDPIARAESTYVYDDAAAFVPAQEGPVGLVTHCQQYLTDPVLSHLDISDWFDVVVCCDDEVGWKPDPDPVELAMSRMGVGHNGHVGVLAGDDADDIGAAQNAGLDSIHVQRRDANGTVDANGDTVLGDHQVRSFSELS
jgi:phosphoglycolate phosphatase